MMIRCGRQNVKEVSRQGRLKRGKREKRGGDKGSGGKVGVAKMPKRGDKEEKSLDKQTRKELKMGEKKGGKENEH